MFAGNHWFRNRKKKAREPAEPLERGEEILAGTLYSATTVQGVFG